MLRVIGLVIALWAAGWQAQPAQTIDVTGAWTVTLGIPKTTYTIDYDMAEIGLFAKANPSRDTAKFMIAAPGKQAIPLQTQ